MLRHTLTLTFNLLERLNKAVGESWGKLGINSATCVPVKDPHGPGCSARWTGQHTQVACFHPQMHRPFLGAESSHVYPGFIVRILPLSSIPSTVRENFDILIGSVLASRVWSV